jgi:hypothetical protein
MNCADLEHQKDALERANPGWRIWFTPRLRGVTWSAMMRLSELASPEDLQQAIYEAEY